MLLLFQTNAFAAPDLGFSVGGCVAPVEVFVVGGEGAVRIDIGWCGHAAGVADVVGAGAGAGFGGEVGDGGGGVGGVG